MKAMLLAAGLGTRLRPITDTIPKALVKVNGITLLEHALRHLQQYGIGKVIINVHHFPGQIIDFLRINNNFGMEVAISDESDLLLDTGGGVKKAGWFFNDGEPFLVRNVDVISDLDLRALESYHRNGRALATLVVRVRQTSRYLLFDEGLHLSGWINTLSGEERITRKRPENLSRLAFSGIQVIDPAIFPLITETGRFSVVDLYLRLSAGHIIKAFIDKDSSWHDAGKMEALRTNN